MTDSKDIEDHESEQAAILRKIHSLGIPELEQVQTLNRLSGAYINLECRLPNGTVGKLLDDGKMYYGFQAEKAGSERCYGVAADAEQVAVYEYGCGGSDAVLIVWAKL